MWANTVTSPLTTVRPTKLFIFFNLSSLGVLTILSTESLAHQRNSTVTSTTTAPIHHRSVSLCDKKKKILPEVSLVLRRVLPEFLSIDITGFCDRILLWVSILCFIGHLVAPRTIPTICLRCSSVTIKITIWCPRGSKNQPELKATHLVRYEHNGDFVFFFFCIGRWYRANNKIIAVKAAHPSLPD